MIGLWLALTCCAAGPADALHVGLAEIDVTPPLGGRPVWLAGFQQNRPARGVHDPLLARAVVLKHAATRFALVTVDVVGLQLPTVREIRRRLPGFDYVLVASTHNHHGPDTIGLWGSTPVTSGVDPEYLAWLVQRVVQAVGQADAQAVAVRAEYGTAQDESLLGDSRLPKVYDGLLRVLAFRRVDGDARAGILVQWNCHPEVLGRGNQLLTADFPGATVAALREKYACPVAYFSGTVGGLMSPPGGLFRDPQGRPLPDDTFDYCQRYGEAVARLAERALETARPIVLSPLRAWTRPVTIPLDNPYYLLARGLGVIDRPARAWTGDFEQVVEPPQGKPPGKLAVETEVAYLRLGELHVACIPGEIYPELVYGQYPSSAEPGVDFPDAPLESPVMKLLPGEKTLLLGLANDEIGYLIPKRQWDQVPPFAYGRTKSQYGEINSCGPEAAPIILRALAHRVREAQERE